MRTIGRTSVTNLIKFDNLAREFCQLANNILLTGKDPSGKYKGDGSYVGKRSYDLDDKHIAGFIEAKEKKKS